MRFIVRWILLAVAVFLAGAICQALNLDFNVRGESLPQWIQLLIGVAVLSLLNNTIGVILKILTLPLTCVTFGLFALVVNAAMLYAAGQLNIGFTVGNFWAAFFASIFISIINGILNGMILKDKDDE